MSEKTALFYAVSGMRGTGRTSLFKRLESLLPDQFGNQKFAFFEDPFGGLTHPLLWAHEERGRHPVSRLFELWSILNEFNVKKLRPALPTNDVVVVDGYGLNALLYATAYVGDNIEEDNEAIDMHQYIVDARVKRQRFPVPFYFITLADCETQTKYLQQTVPDINAEQCYAFIRKEERIIANYFGPGTGQSCQSLNPRLSMTEMTEAVTTAIRQDLTRNRLAA